MVVINDASRDVVVNVSEAKEFRWFCLIVRTPFARCACNFDYVALGTIVNGIFHCGFLRAFLCL